jgi:RNA polymerase sigma-B factor
MHSAPTGLAAVVTSAGPSGIPVARTPSGAESHGRLRIDTEAVEPGGRPRLRVRGELDLATRAQFADALTAAIAAAGDPGALDGAGALVVDLRAVDFVDGGGVEVLAQAARLAADRTVRLRLLPSEALDDVVAALGGWAEVTAGSDAVELAPAPVPAPATAPSDDGGAGSEYGHLVPLLVERARLPVDHPRQPALRAALITGYLPVAQHIARRFRHRGENLDDLEQVATVGLINAVDRFDADRGCDFLSFAVPTITGEVQRHHRDRTSTIRIPRRVRQLQAEVARGVEELRRRDGTAPRPSDVAHHIGVDTADVLEALEANHRAYCSSLDEPFPGDEPAGDNPRFAGALSVQDTDLGAIDDRESLHPLLDALPARERRIVLLRFFGNQTQSQIAAELGISQMHVSRLLSTTLAKLRAELTADAAEPAPAGRAARRGR